MTILICWILRRGQRGRGVLCCAQPSRPGQLEQSGRRWCRWWRPSWSSCWASAPGRLPDLPLLASRLKERLRLSTEAVQMHKWTTRLRGGITSWWVHCNYWREHCRACARTYPKPVALSSCWHNGRPPRVPYSLWKPSGHQDLNNHHDYGLFVQNNGGSMQCLPLWSKRIILIHYVGNHSYKYVRPFLLS